MKQYLRLNKCTTHEETASKIHEFRDSLTLKKCQNYINNIKQVIKQVIHKRGDWSNF